MITHLKTQEYYEDIYDKWTVESCRRMSSNKLELTDDDFEKEKLTAEQIKNMKAIKSEWSGVAREMAVFTFAAERHNNKSQVIDDMMRRDKEQDEKLAKIEPPTHVRCRECLSTQLRLISTDEHHDTSEKHLRVLFMFKCSSCSTNTAYFDNGEQYHVEPTLCPKCQAEKPDHKTKEANHKYTIAYTCKKCSHVWKEVMDFTRKPEPPDPSYMEDRKLYCYSDKVREWADSVRKIGPLMKSFDEHREKQEKIDIHSEALAKIKKLNIPQVIEALRPAIEKSSYADVKFAEPEIARYVTVSFSCMDTKSERDDYESKRSLKKTITSTLADTNWRLMNDSTTYRLGYLQARIKAYESDEDIISLLNKGQKN